MAKSGSEPWLGVKHAAVPAWPLLHIASQVYKHAAYQANPLSHTDMVANPGPYKGIGHGTIVCFPMCQYKCCIVTLPRMQCMLPKLNIVDCIIVQLTVEELQDGPEEDKRQAVVCPHLKIQIQDNRRPPFVLSNSF